MQASFSQQDPLLAEQGQQETKKKRKWDVAADGGMAGPSSVQYLPGAPLLPLQTASTNPMINQPLTAPAAATAALSQEAVEKAREAAKAIAAQLSQANPRVQTPTNQAAAAAAVAAALAAVNNPKGSQLEKEVIINEAVPAIRSHLLKKSTQNELEKRHSVQITVAGRFYTPGQVHDPKEKPLHLFIKPSSVPGQNDQQKAANVLAAANAIIAMMGASAATSSFPIASPSNAGPPTITSLQHAPIQATQQGLLQPPPYTAQHPNASTYYPSQPQGGYTPNAPAYNPHQQHQQPPGHTVPPNAYNPHHPQPPPMGHPPQISAPWGSPAQPHQVAQFVAWVYVNVSSWPPTFNLPERIRGPGGSFLAHVQSVSGATHVHLRGRGSILMEGPDPLHVYIAAGTKQQEQQATALVLDLLKTVKDELVRNHPETAPMVTPSTVIPIPPGAAMPPPGSAAAPPAGFQQQITTPSHGQPAGQPPYPAQAMHNPSAPPHGQPPAQYGTMASPVMSANTAAAGMLSTSVQSAQPAGVQSVQEAAPALVAAKEQQQDANQSQRPVMPAHGYHAPAGPEFPPSAGSQQRSDVHAASTHTAQNVSRYPHQQHANPAHSAAGQPPPYGAPVFAQPYATAPHQSIMAPVPTQPTYGHAPYPPHTPMFGQQGPHAQMPASQPPYMQQQQQQQQHPPPQLQAPMSHAGYSQPPVSSQPPQSHAHVPYNLPTPGHARTPPPTAQPQHGSIPQSTASGTTHTPKDGSEVAGYPPIQNQTQTYPMASAAQAGHGMHEPRSQGGNTAQDANNTKSMAQSAVMSVYSQQTRQGSGGGGGGGGDSVSQKPRQPSPPKRRRFQEFVDKPGGDKQSKMLPSYLSSYVNVTAGSAAQTEAKNETSKSTSPAPEKSQKSDAEKMPPPPPRFVKSSQQQQGTAAVQQQSTPLPGLADYGDADD